MRVRARFAAVAVAVAIATLASVAVATPAAADTVPDGTVSGTVIAASPDGDTSKNRALAGVTVTATEFDRYDDPWHDIVLSSVSTVTDSAGNYRFSGLPDEVNLRFDAPDVFGRPASTWLGESTGGFSYARHGALIETTGPGRYPLQQIIDVPGVVSGSVVCSGCALPDPSQLEVHLAIRDSVGSGFGRDVVHPDARGHFSFSNVLPWNREGGYSLSVVYTGPSALPHTSTTTDFAVAPGESVRKNVTIDAHAPAAAVWHGGSADNVQLRGTAMVSATDDHPASIASGALVSLYSTGNSADELVATVTTAADGTYAFDGLAGGQYWIKTVYTSPSGQKSVLWAGQSAWTEPSPFGLHAHDFVILDPEIVYTGTVTGHLSCEQYTALPTPTGGGYSAELRYGFGDEIWQTVGTVTVAADGTFRFDNVYPTANLNIRVSYAGPDLPASVYPVGDSVMVTVGEGETVNADVLLPVRTPFDYRDGSSVAVVYSLYWDYLRRQPTVEDVKWWSAKLDTGPISTAGIAQSFVQSDEYRLLRIDAAYRSILGRGADAAGRQNWLRAMKGGAITTDDIETSFYASTEWFQAHGGSNTGFAKALYSTLLGREASPADVSFWAGLAGTHGRAWVIAQFWDTRETIAGRVSAMYRAYLGRVPDAGGLAAWVGVALAIGDSGLRAGLTSSDEYLARSHLRYVNP